MHLRDGRRGEWRFVEHREHAFEPMTISTFDDGARLRTGKGRHMILQLGEFGRDVVAEQIAPCGKNLAEFNKQRAEVLEHRAQALSARPIVSATPVPGQQIEHKGYRAEHRLREDDLVEAMADQHTLNGDDAQKLRQQDHEWGRRSRRRLKRASNRSRSSARVKTARPSCSRSDRCTTKRDSCCK